MASIIVPLYSGYKLRRSSQPTPTPTSPTLAPALHQPTFLASTSPSKEQHPPTQQRHLCLQFSHPLTHTVDTLTDSPRCRITQPVLSRLSLFDRIHRDTPHPLCLRPVPLVDSNTHHTPSQHRQSHGCSHRQRHTQRSCVLI